METELVFNHRFGHEEGMCHVHFLVQSAVHQIDMFFVQVFSVARQISFEIRALSVLLFE